MAIYIANAEADRLARELAQRTGETLTEAIVTSLRERLDRLPQVDSGERFARALKLATEMRAMIGSASLETDDLYGDDGLPN